MPRKSGRSEKSGPVPGNTSGTKLQRRRLEQPGKMHEKLEKQEEIHSTSWAPPADQGRAIQLP